MPTASGPIALLYDDDAYVETLRTSPGPRGEGRPLGLMGRQVAGKEFLRALLDHGAATELVALVRDSRSAESLKALWREKTWRPHARKLQIITEAEFHEAMVRGSLEAVLHVPCPPDSRFAWVRRGTAPQAFALSGVTHTLCSFESVRQICDYVTAPFEPFDALVCTSKAVLGMVREVSQSYSDYLRGRVGGQPALGLRLVHIPLGVDTDRYRPATPDERAQQRQTLGIGDQEVAVLFVGRLSHHAKAHPFPMFDGLARAVQETGQAVHLVLSGWAASPAMHEAFVQGARLFAPGLRVTFVNGENPSQRFAVWRAADLFCSLSDNIQETFGLVIVEAMACGLPVVASDWNGYRDLVVHGATGLLVPTAMVAGATEQTTSRLVLGEINYDHFLAECSQATIVDPAAAAAAFRGLLTDPDRRAAMGEAGRRRALELFTWPRVIRQYELLWTEQEELRRQYRKNGQPKAAPVGPPLYPEPESSFRGYPTVWLNQSNLVTSDPAAPERLGTFLRTPLTHHAGQRRVADPTILANVLRSVAQGCSIAHIDNMLMLKGVDRRTSRATLAWLLKYGLVQAGDMPAPGPAAPAERLPSAVHPSGSSGDGSSCRLTFVTVCRDRLLEHGQTLERLIKQPCCCCVVVDYTCPQHASEWVAARYSKMSVVRVGDHKEFHRAEARNLGAAAATTPWICFIDVDLQIAPNFAETILPRLQSGFFFRPDPFLVESAGSIVCSRDDFQRAGGYDEVPRAWEEADEDLFSALELLGTRPATFPAALVRPMDDGIGDRSRRHPPGPILDQAVNRVYRILKWDTARLRGSLLTMAMRQELYQTVRDVVTRAWKQDIPGDLRVRLPHGIVPGDRILPRGLVYQLVKETVPPGPTGSQADAERQASGPVNEAEAG